MSTSRTKLSEADICNVLDQLDPRITMYGQKLQNDIEAAFGICQPKRTASSQDIKSAIRYRGKMKRKS